MYEKMGFRDGDHFWSWFRNLLKVEAGIIGIMIAVFTLMELGVLP